MGYLEEDLRLRAEEERRLAAAPAEAERAANEHAERMERERLFQEKLRRENEVLAAQDQGKILELLDNLPSDLNFKELLGAVERQTGFESSSALYTRKGVNGVSKELEGKLVEKGLDAHPMLLMPSQVYLGDVVKPRTWYLARLTEPPEPGIGIRFRKKLKKENKSRTFGSYIDVTTHANVYLRLRAPRDVVITGQGRSIQILSIKDLDDALEDGFRRRHKSTHTHKWAAPQVSLADDPKWNMGG